MFGFYFSAHKKKIFFGSPSRIALRYNLIQINSDEKNEKRKKKEKKLIIMLINIKTFYFL